jgi:hypothetical protein
MRKTLIALAATTGLLGFGTFGASALTLGPMNGSDQTSQNAVIQQADWCGPRCEHWRHRRWEEHRRWDEGRHWQNYHNGYDRYGYNGGYRYYYR